MSQPTARAGSPLIPWREIVSLDLRSLAALRIGLGALLVLDWVDRLPDLRAHYSDAGVMPRHALDGILPLSIHLFSGATWFQGALAGVAIVLAGLLAVGYRTPVVTLFSWLMLLSVHGRNVSLLQGGDMLLRLLLFWGMFLPLGACWSIDARNPRARPRTKAVASLGAFAFLLQLCLVYLFASAWKWAPEWRDDGTAVHQALSVSYFTTDGRALIMRRIPWRGIHAISGRRFISLRSSAKAFSSSAVSMSTAIIALFFEMNGASFAVSRYPRKNAAEAQRCQIQPHASARC